MAASITTFRNVRARLNRADSDSWLAGWVTHLAREEARIRLWNYIPMEGGERVHCECYGQGTVARFSGHVLAQAGPDLAINLVGSISYAPSEETPRIYASGLTGRIEGPDGQSAVTVLDLSPLSLGLLAEAMFGISAELTMTLDTEMGPIAAKVKVANCRRDPDNLGYYRLGLNIVDMGRLDRARWGRLVAERADA